MTTSLQDVRDQRASVWDQMTKINDRAEAEGKLSTEDSAAYDKAEKEFDELKAEIERRERFEKASADNAKVDRSGVVGPGSEHVDDQDASQVYNEAFQIFVQNGMADLDGTQRQALKSGFAAMDPREVRNAAGVGTSTAGGYLVPPEFREKIIEKMKAYGHVMDVATVITTDTGATLPWPTHDGTGNVGALLAENTAASELDEVFGTAQVGAYKYTSKITRVSLEFIQDVSWVDAQSYLQARFAERLGRIHNQHFTTGTGVNQPLGIVSGSVTGVTAASATAFTADELIDLQHSVDPAYRTERSQFMLTDGALKVARKLKNGQGQYYFQVSTSGDVPDLLVGSRYTVNQDMAPVATGNKTVLYGDFEAGYLVRSVKSMELMQLRERYAEFGQVGYIAFDRMDGTVQDTGAYKALQQA